MKKTIKRGSIISLALMLSLSGLSPAWSQDQLQEDMIVLNPGGGVRADGTDGIRIHFNDFKSLEQRGSDQIYYKNTVNWFGSGVGPTLAIGGDVVNTAGMLTSLAQASDGVRSFSNLTISGLTGAFQRFSPGTTDASITTYAGTGDAGVTLTYEVMHESGRNYIVQRVITYTSPNTYYDETWTVTIPAGHPAGEEVKLYVGGDTAPGGTTTGTGLLREVDGLKTIYSTSTVSGQYIAYAERLSTEAWDGWFSGSYGIPYELIPFSDDLSFLGAEAVDNDTHDTGLHVQWDIGSAPGQWVRTMRTMVGPNSDFAPPAPAAPAPAAPAAAPAAAAPAPVLAKTGADSWSAAGLSLAALALVGFGVARIASRRTKKA